MKKLTINLTDKQHCMISRIAKGDKRKVEDLIYLALAGGFEFMFCETPLHIEKVDSDYTDAERIQIAKNKKLEATKGWDDLTYEEQSKRGYEHVCGIMANFPIKDDFMPGLAKSLERNATEGLKENA